MKTITGKNTEYDPTCAFRVPNEIYQLALQEALTRHLKLSDILREMAWEWYEKRRKKR